VNNFTILNVEARICKRPLDSQKQVNELFLTFKVLGAVADFNTAPVSTGKIQLGRALRWF